MSFSLWPFGPLYSGASAVAVANLTGILFIYLWTAQFIWTELHHSFVGVVVASVYAFFLVLVNASLLNAVNRARKTRPLKKTTPRFILVWLVAYAVTVGALIVVCAVFFTSMERLAPIAIAAIFVLAYFYAIVFSFFNEVLRRVKESSANDEDVEEAKEMKSVQTAKDEEIEINAADETFTDLAHRNGQNGNPFLPPSTLPKPDEVIEVKPPIVEEQEPLLIKAEDKTDAPLIVKANNPFAEDAAKMATDRPKANLSSSSSALIDIDSSFTPFKASKVKNVDEEDAKTPPKMKIFLPKDSESSSSEDEN